MKLIDVLKNTFRIGWNHKVLWWWQIIPSISVIFVFPLYFIYYPTIEKIIEGPELQTPIESWITNSSNLIIFLFVLSYVILNIFVQVATINSVVSIDMGEPKTSFKENFFKSFSYFWRVLGLYFIWIGILLVINIPPSLAYRALHESGYLFPEYLFFFLALLLSLITYGSLIILLLAQSAIIVDNLSLYTAILEAFKVFKNNKLNSILLMIVLYFGITIPFGLIMFPLPFIFIFTVLFLTRLPDPNTIVFIAFFVFIPLIVVITTFFGRVFLSFFHCSWVLAYLKMKQTYIVNLIEEK